MFWRKKQIEAGEVKAANDKHAVKEDRDLLAAVKMLDRSKRRLGKSLEAALTVLGEDLVGRKN